MKTLVVIFLFFISIQMVTGQNLIPNSGFEDTLECPSSTGQMSACSNWSPATQSLPNYYHRCADNIFCKVPTTTQQETLDGDGMIGIQAFHAGGDYRQYAQVSLTSPLVIGQTYYVSLHVMLHAKNQHAIKNLGTCFTMNPVWNITSEVLDLSPQYENNSVWLGNKTYWTNISGSFIADSAYTNMIIGNFKSDANTESLYIGPSEAPGSFFFIDNVCVSTSSSDCQSLVANVTVLEPTDKQLVKIVNSRGQECKEVSGQLLFYIYDDGSVEKKVLSE
jgi:hypothetical protein